MLLLFRNETYIVGSLDRVEERPTSLGCERSLSCTFYSNSATSFSGAQSDYTRAAACRDLPPTHASESIRPFCPTSKFKITQILIAKAKYLYIFFYYSFRTLKSPFLFLCQFYAISLRRSNAQSSD